MDLATELAFLPSDVALGRARRTAHEMPRSVNPTTSNFDLGGGRTLRLTWSGNQPIVTVLDGKKQVDYAKVKPDMSKDAIASALKKARGVIVPNEFMAKLVAGRPTGELSTFILRNVTPAERKAGMNHLF